MLQLPPNEREAKVLRDACDVHGIAPHSLRDMNADDIKDILMHLRPIDNKKKTSVPMPAPPSMMALPAVASVLSPPPLEQERLSAKPSEGSVTAVHDKSCYVAKELERIVTYGTTRRDADAEVERRWESKKRRLLDCVDTMRVDGRDDVETECIRNGWTLYLVDGATRYYKEPKGLAATIDASAAAGAAAVARSMPPPIAEAVVDSAPQDADPPEAETQPDHDDRIPKK